MNGIPETVATSSCTEDDTDSNDDSDRHSTTSSSSSSSSSSSPITGKVGTEKYEQSRRKKRKTKERISDGWSDDNLPEKFRSRKRSRRSRSPSIHGEDRRRPKRRHQEHRRRNRHSDDFPESESRSRSREWLCPSKSRHKRRPSYSPPYIRRDEIKKEEPVDDGDEPNDHEKSDLLRKTAQEDAIWAERRKERERRCEWGVRSVWGRSPLMHEIHEIYVEYEKMEEELRKEEEQLPQPLNVNASKMAKKLKKEKKGHKKKHKDKKHKKKHKKSSSESEEEWVEVTAEMREAEAAREKMEEAAMIGPAIPDHLQKQAAAVDMTKRVNYGKDMLRGEAAAMASYIAQGKRIPRRGEIGLSSAEISEYEKIGYVMSGTRHKSMEATRLRKENQVMTAEEKRLLSGFTHDERKKKEEIVLQQFKSFIESKKGKN